MSKAVQEMFTSIAPKYDFLNHFMSLTIDRKWRQLCLEAFKNRSCDRLLDLCAGTLDLSQNFAAEFSQMEVVSLDFSLAMLNQGRNKVQDYPSVQLVCADGHHIPFPDDSFDAIVCAFGIRNLEDRQQAAGEIRRVLRPKGTLLVLEFFRPEKLFSKVFYATYGKHVIPRIGGLISKNRQAYEYLQQSILNFLSVEEYQKLLRETGFKKTGIMPLSGGIAHRVIAE